jgi:hypothetical protein
MDDLELLPSSKVMIEVSFNYNNNIDKQNKWFQQI